MWYTGVGAGPVFRIGYASSPDGIVWTKAVANPILTVGNSGSYDAGGVEHPTVVGPDNQGGYAMWFQGVPGFTTGYATATNETTWTKYGSNPVFTSNAFYPRVIHEGSVFEMWYCIGTTQPASFGYATSSDGIGWTPFSENPVLRPGTAGSWDDAQLLPGDVMFDGNIYHLWYAGNDGSVFRSGYAVSPKGLNVEVSTVGHAPTDTLFCQWIPPGAGLYSISVILTLKDTLRFLKENVANVNTSSGDTVTVTITVDDTTGQTYSAVMFSGGVPIDTVTFTVASTSGVAERDPFAEPRRFHLYQNYPNPFNPSTTIQFSVISSEFTVLKIFDVLGREVATLVSERLTPGRYQLTWNATGFPSGVYFCRLIGEGISETRRLVLMR